MANVNLPPQQQLTQALGQISRLSPASPEIKQAADVIVKHLSQAQVTLQQPRNDRQVSLDRQAMTGKLAANQHYHSRIDTSQTTPSLQFMQLVQTSNVPAVQVEQAQTDILLRVLQSTGAGNKSAAALLGTVQSIRGNQLTLSVNAGGKPQTISLVVTPAANNVKVGDKLLVQLTGNDTQPKVNLQPAAASGKAMAQAMPMSAAVTLKQMQILLSGKESNTSTPTRAADIAARQVTVSAQALQQLVRNQPTSPAQQSLLSQLNNISADNLKVTLRPGGISQIFTADLKQVAQIPLDKASVEALKVLQIPRVSGKELAQMSATAGQPEKLTSGQRLAPETLLATSKPDAMQRPLGVGSQVPLETVRALLTRVMPHSESPTLSVERLQRALSDPSIPISENLRQIVKQLQSQLSATSLIAQTDEAQQIKQLVSAPVTITTPQSLTSPPARQGLMAGLMTMLQISLAARLSSNHPATLEKLATVIPRLFPTSTAAGPMVQGARNMNDWQQLDQRHQMLRDISRALSTHQTHKLMNLEQLLQGQDTFYYALPNMLSTNKSDIEALIRRAPEEQQEESAQEMKTKAWLVTLKFDLSETGQLLTKAKVRDETVELDLYASNEETRKKVLEYLPLLQNRFEELGVDLSDTRCQLGKIPETLKPRAYQIVETQA